MCWEFNAELFIPSNRSLLLAQMGYKHLVSLNDAFKVGLPDDVFSDVKDCVW